MPARTSTRSGRRFRSGAAVAAVTVGASTVLAACGGSSGGSGSTPTLTYYINPDSTGSTQKAALACAAESGGKYKISISVLPATADGQREQIVRRLAAHDSSIDFVTVDPPYTAELANAGWLLSLEPYKTQLLQGVLKAPIASATWQGKLIAEPYSANTQLLWYRKSVAQKAGVDPTSPTFTWQQMLDAALKTNTTIAEQGNRYEGYMVWVNAMVLDAGGSILTNNDRGRDATVSLNSAAGQQAAAMIKKVASSKAAAPDLNTALEENSRNTFQGPTGGFMLNWPYAYAAAKADVKAGTIKASVLDDIAWARYPRLDANIPSRPPLGGANLAISKFSKHPVQAEEAVACLATPAKEKIRILGLGDPVANGTLYDDPEVKKAFPMAALMRESINAAGPRPVTPFYGDVSGAIQRDWQPADKLNPTSTPKSSASLITDVLHDKRML